MKKQSYAVNFLRGQEEKIIDKLVDWALSAGRTIVIITESIALLAFLYRFDLDRQIIDLHDKIKQEQVIVNLLQANEQKFRGLQDRLKQAKTVDLQANSSLSFFQEIVAAATGKVVLDDLAITGKTISISATTSSPNRLNLFLTELRKLPNLESVSIDKVENKTTVAEIDANISAIIRQ